MIIKIFRWLIFIILSIGVLFLIDFLFGWIAEKIINLSAFWLIVVTIFLGTFIIGIFMSICSILIGSLFLLPTNKKVGGIIFGLLALGLGLDVFITYLNHDMPLFPKIALLINIALIWGSIVYSGFTINAKIE